MPGLKACATYHIVLKFNYVCLYLGLKACAHYIVIKFNYVYLYGMPSMWRSKDKLVDSVFSFNLLGGSIPEALVLGGGRN